MPSLVKALRFLYGLRTGRGPSGAGVEAGGGPADSGGPGGAAWIHWAVPAGAALGVLLALLTSLSWRVLTLRRGDGGLWVAVAPILLIYWLGPGAARYLSWGRVWADLRIGQRSADGEGSTDWSALMMLGLVAAGVVHGITLATLPIGGGWVEQLGVTLNRILFPRAIYGAIILMCMWGNGSVLLAGCLGRAAEGACPQVADLLSAGRARKMLWALLPPIAVGALYLFGWRWRGGQDWASVLALAGAHSLAIGVILFGTAMLYGWLLARRGRGHCRATLLSAGLIGELAFLLMFHTLVK